MNDQTRVATSDEALAYTFDTSPGPSDAWVAAAAQFPALTFVLDYVAADYAFAGRLVFRDGRAAGEQAAAGLVNVVAFAERYLGLDAAGLRALTGRHPDPVS